MKGRRGEERLNWRCEWHMHDGGRGERKWNGKEGRKGRNKRAIRGWVEKLKLKRKMKGGGNGKRGENGY